MVSPPSIHPSSDSRVPGAAAALRVGFALTVVLFAASTVAETQVTAPIVPSTLAGHAMIPALSLLPPPDDAPRDLWISGKFVGGQRNDQAMSQAGTTGASQGNRSTGIRLPFIGQPLQGFSGFAMQRDGESIHALVDNGFGNKQNSTDAMLRFHRIRPDWQTGHVEILQTSLLHDPDRKVPFRITQEATDTRYLTGGDFDPESIQVVGDTVWIGEEFGPYLISTTLSGRVTGVYEARANGEVLRSPDNPSLRIPAKAGEDYSVARSGGFEGMALSPDGSRLWAMLEKPLTTAEGDSQESGLRVMAFDPESAQWTGEQFRYPLDAAAAAIGDFNFIDDHRALVIERDGGEGDPSLACANADQPQPDCFPQPALHKRIVLIDTADLDESGFARKLAQIDLMDIQDPDGLSDSIDTDAARDLSGIFTFPFVTIESVMRVDEEHIVVAMDNNLPFSSGRQLDQAADNEFILLRVPELLSYTQ